MARKRKSELPTVQENPPWLVTEPEGPPPSPPVISRATALPFDKLEWRNFERLCRRLAERGGEVEKVHAYGKPGQAQGGIDILLRLVDGTYVVWQVKCHRRVTPAQVRAAVDLFLRHEWKAKAKKLVLAVACDLDSTGNVKAIEEANLRLAGDAIAFEPLDAAELSKRLAVQPDIVDDFFDRPWVEALCPPEATEVLGRRLSRFAAADLRRSLRDWFTAWVSNVDPGLPLAHLGRDGRVAPSIPIGDRYIRPDFLVRAVEPAASPPAAQGQDQVPEVSGDLVAEGGASRRWPRTAPPPVRERRVEADRFLAGERHVVISADAGMGKSTLLRVIALDILSDSPKLTAFRELEGFIPVWVPFALWTRMASDRAAPPPLEDVVREFYRAQSEPELGEAVARALGTSKAIVLVDGLDESSDATAARTVAALLATFAESRRLPVLVTSRPHGLQGIAGFGGRWARAELAPLSDAQRHALSKLWFKVIGGLEAASHPNSAKLDAQAERRASGLDDALRRNPGVSRLSQTPLFLLALMQLHRHQQELPRSRFAAIEKIIEELVEHQPRRRETEALVSKGVAGIKPIQRDRLLGNLAFDLHSGKLTGPVTDAAAESSAITHAARFLMQRQGSQDLDTAEETARSVLAFAEERAGLLVKKASGTIGFLHLSIQEFLAARHLAQLPLTDRLAFVRVNSEKPRWREPILYLLYLEKNEGHVGQLVEAIAHAQISSGQGHYHHDALLADAVFSDFAHDIGVAAAHARRLLNEAELTSWGERERHVLRSAVDGLASEAVGPLCAAKIVLWVPNRHGYARAGAFRMMPSWPSSTHADCRKVLLRSLGSDEEQVQRAAAEVLAAIAEPGGQTKADIAALLQAAPSVTVMGRALYALGCGWANDDDVGHLAAAARTSPDPGMAREALSIRAKRNETDDADFERFLRLTYSGRSLIGGMAERGLIEHFAQTRRDAFALRLAEVIERKGQHNPRDLLPLIGSLLLCNPIHPLVEPGMRDLLAHDWNIRKIFAERSFPADRIIWTPALAAEIERFAAGHANSVHDYELYWIAKAHPFPAVKAQLLRQVGDDTHFRSWAARALVEVWGAGDPEVSAALLAFLDRPGEDVASIAEALPAVCDDKQECRTALLRAMQSKAQGVAHIFRGLRALGVAKDDEEMFAASMAAAAKLGAPVYQWQWREQMVLTFPKRLEVRKIAWEELHRRDGEIAAVARSYAGDAEMTTEMLRVLAPLPEAERLILATALQGPAATDDRAARMLEEIGEDTDSAVAAEGVIGTAETLVARGAMTEAHVQRLTDALETVGPDYNARRATVVDALAVVGRLDKFAAATEQKGEPLRISPMGSIRVDDRHLRRVLRYWPEFSRALGGDEAVIERMEFSAETILPLLSRDEPNAEHLFGMLRKSMASSPHLAKHVQISSLATFEPRGIELRAIVRNQLLFEGEYWGGLVAAEVFAEQFSGDAELAAEVVKALTLAPAGFAAAAALAELVLRRPDETIEKLLREKTEGVRYDAATHFKLLAALSSPDHVVEALVQLLAHLPLDVHELQLSRWVPAMVRRVERDVDLQAALGKALIASSLPSEQASFAAILSRAGGLDARANAHIQTQIGLTQPAILPEVGFDIVAQAYRVVEHVLVEALS